MLLNATHCLTSTLSTSRNAEFLDRVHYYLPQLSKLYLISLAECRPSERQF